MLPNLIFCRPTRSRYFGLTIRAITFFSILTFFPAGILWSQQPAVATDNLARVAIVNFSDMTGSQNYAYLSSSLSSAINTSMQTKFEYVALDPAMTAATATEIMTRNGKFDSSEANEFCKRTGADILVYGFYTFDPLTNQIVMQTKINFALISRNVTLDPLLNPIDASLFQATDIMASKIVEKIAEMAKKTMALDGTQIADNQKVSLTKLDEVSWSKVNYELSFYGGHAPGVNGKLTELTSGYLYGLEFLSNSDFRKSYAGFTVLGFDQSGRGLTHKGWAVMAQLGLTPFTIAKRIKPFLELDLGYGSSKLSSLTRQIEGGVWIGARVGLKFLLTSRLSLNLDSRVYRIQSDVASWFFSANAGIGFTF